MKSSKSPLQNRKIASLIALFVSMFFTVASFAQTISSFSPSVVTKGTAVIINGTGFTASSVVKLGGTTVSVSSWSATQLKVFVATGSSGSVTVTNGSVVATATGSIVYVSPSNTSSTAAITRVVTDFQGYWSSASSARNTTLPDNRHNLVALTYNGTLYSTGVNDASLTSHSDVFTPRVFKAFSTDGITGNTGTSSSNYIALGSKVDGNSTAANYLSPAVAGLTVRDVLIDGINGLDLGTGVTNVTSSMVMAYKVSNIVPSTINDNEPDVLITQTAAPTSVTDVYSFVDVNGNIVGNPISADLSAISHVGTYSLDLFTLPNNIPYENAVPSGNADSNTTREIRLIAFKFSEFGITAANYASIDKFKLMPGGNSDPAFIAYNANSFLISVPEIIENPVSAVICSGSTSSITFSVTATGPDLTYQWKKNNINITGATSSSYTIISPSNPSDLASYSVVVSNIHGSVISIPATLTVGTGTSEWDGLTWIGGAPTADKNIVFSGNYTSTGNISGCSCTVNSGAVTMLSNHTMTIQNQVAVAPAASLIFNNSASLVQINNAAVNTGKISVIRTTQPIRRYDYTYWSSPVAPLTLHDLSPATLADKYYKFDTAINNWVSVPNSTEMVKAKGYIVRAPQTYSLTVPATYTATMSGTPNTGEITIQVAKGAGKSNLIGNPYPSGLDVNLFLGNPTNKAAIGGTVYLWTHATLPNATTGSYAEGDYAKWNLTGPVKATSPNAMMPTGIIASGQSFFVEGASGIGNANAVFKNYMRAGSGNNQFYRQGNSSENTPLERHRFWLNLQNADGIFNQALVGYLKSATNDLDRDFDGKIYGENAAILYSIVADEKLAIQGRSMPFQENDAVQLGYIATTAGNLSISIDQVDGLFDSQNIYLKDNLLNVVHDLKSSGYSFASNIGTFNDRFEIVYKLEPLGVENPSWSAEAVIVYKKDKSIFINAGKETIDQVRVIDLQGRIVYENKKVNNTQTVINSLPSSEQIFIVQVQNAEGAKIAKKIIY